MIFTPKFGPKTEMIQQEQEHCLLGTQIPKDERAQLNVPIVHDFVIFCL